MVGSRRRGGSKAEMGGVEELGTVSCVCVCVLLGLSCVEEKQQTMTARCVEGGVEVKADMLLRVPGLEVQEEL